MDWNCIVGTKVGSSPMKGCLDGDRGVMEKKRFCMVTVKDLTLIHHLPENAHGLHTLAHPWHAMSPMQTRPQPSVVNHSDFLNPRCTHPQKLSHSTWSRPRSHCTSTSLASVMTRIRNASWTSRPAASVSMTPSRRLRSKSRRYARFHTFWLASPMPVAGSYARSRPARCVLIVSCADAGDTEEGSAME
jgi:hypothetical protein